MKPEALIGGLAGLGTQLGRTFTLQPEKFRAQPRR